MQNKDARILVLDGIDKKGGTQWTLSKLYDVIDYRCIHNLPTIITANRGVGELSTFWSREKKSEDLCKAIISRIMGQIVKVIHFEGEDYRFCGSGA
jgi:DNA replication protein DnaC